MRSRKKNQAYVNFDSIPDRESDKKINTGLKPYRERRCRINVHRVLDNREKQYELSVNLKLNNILSIQSSVAIGNENFRQNRKTFPIGFVPLAYKDTKNRKNIPSKLRNVPYRVVPYRDRGL